MCGYVHTYPINPSNPSLDHNYRTTIRITNALGQVVLTTTMPANTTKLSLDLSGLANGVYMVQAPGFGVTKLVKE